MAGIVFAPDGRDWTAPSSVFYWAVDALAAQVQNLDLAARLREISEHNLGSLDVRRLPATEQQDLTAAARALPEVAGSQLPASPAREAVVAQISQLAALFDPP